MVPVAKEGPSPPCIYSPEVAGIPEQGVAEYSRTLDRQQFEVADHLPDLGLGGPIFIAIKNKGD